MSKKIIKTAFYGMVLSFLVLPMVVAAAVQTPPSTTLTIAQLYTSAVTLMNYVFTAGLALAIMLMVWGGISYMTAGGDDEKITTAKKRIIWGLVGAAIIIGAWAAVTLISIFLGITAPTLPT